MILEELCGSFVALVSSLVIHTPPMSGENLQGEYTLIFEENPDREEVYDGLMHREYEPGENLQGEYTLVFEENPDREEVYDGLMHREYEPETPTELPYYEENLSVLAQANEQPRRHFCQSFIRSCKTN